MMCGEAACNAPDCTWGESHRRQCEARMVMHWDKEVRNAHYAAVKNKRGEEAAKALIAEVKNQYHGGGI